jgi:hypothetical protein
MCHVNTNHNNYTPQARLTENMFRKHCGVWRESLRGIFGVGLEWVEQRLGRVNGIEAMDLMLMQVIRTLL